MSKETKDALWERLEALVIQWKALGEGDDAVRLKLNVEIGQALMALFPPTSKDWEYLSYLWEVVQKNFDPSKGSLKNYWGHKLDKIKIEIYHKDRDDHCKTIKPNDEEAGEKKDGETNDGKEKDGKRKSKWVSNISLDRPISSEDANGQTLGDLLPDSTASGPEERAEMHERFLALLSLILDLPTKLHGQANNPARVRYYRMFFTDEAADIIARGGGAFFLRHERDLFRAMYLAFLDFFMAASCRTVAAVERAHLKPYGEMVPGRPMEEATQPLPIDVYTQYLRTEGVELRSDATISNQRDAYRTFKRENLL